MPKSQVRVIQIPTMLTEKGSKDVYLKAADNGLREIGAVGSSKVQDRIRGTTDSRGYKGRVDKALMVKSITAGRPRRSGERVTQETFSQPPASQWTIVNELGRRPGKKPPPPKVIESWLKRTQKGRSFLMRVKADLQKARRKVPSDAILAARMAFIVARSIGRKGVPGIFMFRRTAEELRQGLSAKIFAKHLNRLTKGGKA